LRHLKEIEDLVRETFSLWDEKRQGFSWRNYYWNHTSRVRALCLEIGRREGADLEKLAYAATLHDITKRYDGRILTDENGRRITDEKGFWITELVMPKRENLVTKLYHEHNLYRTLHNISGAFIAGEILKRYGFPSDFIESVKLIIEAHLKPLNADEDELKRLYSPLESRILHDADMMDANLGYVAFFRNIQIHTYSMIRRNGRADLRRYVEGLPRWIDMKEGFVERLMTPTARHMGEERQRRKRELWGKLRMELEEFEFNRRYGLLGVIEYFMSCADDPNLVEQMSYLEGRWIPQRLNWIEGEGDTDVRSEARRAVERVIEFKRLLSDEIEGRA